MEPVHIQHAASGMAQEPMRKPPTKHITAGTLNWVTPVARTPSYLLADLAESEALSLQAWTPGIVSAVTAPPAHPGSHCALCPKFSGKLSLLLHPGDIPLWSVNQAHTNTHTQTD